MKNKWLTFGLLLILSVSCQTKQYTIEPHSDVDIPENVLFIAQSGTQDSMFQTLIDLENNEMVVLEYSSGILSIVYHTGITLDPDHYINLQIEGTDAPHKNKDVKDSSTPPQQ